MAVSGPGHSSGMRRAATMYGQSFREVGRGGVGPLRLGGASLCWGRSLTSHRHRSVGIPEVRWVHLARQYIALPRAWLPLQMESSVSREAEGLHLLAWLKRALITPNKFHMVSIQDDKSVVNK